MFGVYTEWYALPDSVRPPTACTYTVHAAWNSWSGFHLSGVAMYVYWSPTLPPVGCYPAKPPFFFRRQLRCGYILCDFSIFPTSALYASLSNVITSITNLNFCVCCKRITIKGSAWDTIRVLHHVFSVQRKGRGTASHKRQYRGGQQGCRTDAASAQCKGQTYSYI